MRSKGFVLVSLLLATGCKPPTPAEQLDAMVSWVSTAKMAGDAWLRHTTPDKYTRQTLELSDQMLLETGSQLLKSPPATIDSAAFDQALTSTRFNIAEMARFVEEKDAGKCRQPWDSLRIYLKTMKDFSDKVSAGK
jgi:hypothetical protein